MPSNRPKCTALNYEGEPCKRPVYHSSPIYCYSHLQKSLGLRPFKDNSKKRKSKHNPFQHAPVDKCYTPLADIPPEIMKLYGKRIGPKLKDLLRSYLEDAKAHDISEEIALARTIAGDSIAMYSGIVEDTTLPPVAHKALLAETGAQVMEAMEQVTRLVERAAKVHALTVDKIPPSAVDECIEQICRFVYQVFGEQHDKIMEFDRLISEELQLPTLKQLGTTIHPRDQVLAMDDTIPLI